TTWTTGSRAGVSSRNEATGAVAAHVYETAGTYFVSLTITDGTSTASNSCTQIVVQDPDVVFAGTNTICVAATSLPVAGADGCPAGAMTAQQPSFAAAIGSYATTGRRVLFRRGDIFGSTTSASITADGPGTIGAYGSGAPPVLSETAAADALDISSASTPTTVNDWRIMDLEINGNSVATAGINALGGATQITVLRLNIHHTNFGIELSHYVLDYWNQNGHPGHVIWEQIGVVDSVLSTFSNIAMYASAGRAAVMGNSMDTAPYQIVRLPQMYYGVISNNVLSGGGAGYTTLRIDGPAWCVDEPQTPTACNHTNDSVPTLVTGAHGGYTDLVEVSDNLIAAAADVYMPVEMAPSNGNWDSRIRNVVFERNFVRGATSGVNISSQDITARNNLIRLTGGGYHGVFVGLRSPGSVEPPPLRISVYNNTFYAPGNLTGVVVDALATDVTVRNNLAFAPNGAAAQMIDDAGATNLVATNNSADAQVIAASPLFANGTGAMSLPSDFVPTGASYAIGTGAVVPVWSDLFLVPQTSTRDMGAVTH
ncbi:MAG: hypothetical protein AAB426_10770, partial [Myxococcota bacterium]